MCRFDCSCDLEEDYHRCLCRKYHCDEEGELLKWVDNETWSRQVVNGEIEPGDEPTV